MKRKPIRVSFGIHPFTVRFVAGFVIGFVFIHVCGEFVDALNRNAEFDLQLPSYVEFVSGYDFGECQSIQNQIAADHSVKPVGTDCNASDLYKHIVKSHMHKGIPYRGNILGNAVVIFGLLCLAVFTLRGQWF